MTERNPWRKAFFLLLSATGLFAIGIALGLALSDQSEPGSNSSDVRTQFVRSEGTTRVPTAAPLSGSNGSGDFSEVAEHVLPVVVEVTTVQVVEQQRRQSPFDFFFGPREENGQEFERPGLGSGVIVDQDGSTGFIVTNDHVVGESDDIEVSLNDGRQFEAELVGRDPRQDLALISIEVDGELPIASFGDSEDTRVGEWVLAVGNPLGFESTVTAGIISATGRQAAPGSPIADFTDYIQTDAAINRGNSGGALVNMSGELIGINTWIAGGGPTGGSIGIGFAIPVNTVASTVEQIRTEGRVVYGWLGVSIGDIKSTDDSLARELELETSDGSLILGVYQDSPAAGSGIRPGDFVTEIGGNSIDTSFDLQQVVGRLSPGDSAEFVFYRAGTEHRKRITIAERGPEEEIGQTGDLWPGMQPVPLTPEIRRQQGIPEEIEGALIARVEQETAAATAGIRPGDIVVEVDGETVDGVGDFYRLTAEASGRITFEINRGGSLLSVGFETL